MKGLYCIPLLSTYDEPADCPFTVHRSDVPFPEQLNVNTDALFSNVVQSWDGEMITLVSTRCNINP